MMTDVASMAQWGTHSRGRPHDAIAATLAKKGRRGPAAGSSPCCTAGDAHGDLLGRSILRKSMMPT